MIVERGDQILLKKVSVIIPVYNAAHHIERTVRLFVEAFIGYRLEIIVVDDGSKDNTAAVLSRLQKEIGSLIRPIFLKKNGGQHHAVFCGLFNAKGDYIITTDDDMEVLPVHFVRAVEYLEKEGRDLVVVTYKKTDSSFGSKIFNLIYRRFYGVEYVGTNHKVFTNNLLNRLKPFYSKIIFMDSLLYYVSENQGFYNILDKQKNTTDSRYDFMLKVRFAWSALYYFFVFLLFIRKRGDVLLSQKSVQKAIKKQRKLTLLMVILLFHATKPFI